MLYLIFYIIFLASVSLAASSSLLYDIFFFISFSHRRLKIREVKNFQMFAGISSVSTTISIAALVLLMSIRVSNGATPGENTLVALMLMLVVALICSSLMRNIHLPALQRRQHDYHHLSDSFHHHQESLISTSTVSFVSWIFILTIVSADSRNLIAHVDFWSITISYIVIAYVLSKMVVFLKKKIS